MIHLKKENERKRNCRVYGFFLLLVVVVGLAANVYSKQANWNKKAQEHQKLSDKTVWFKTVLTLVFGVIVSCIWDLGLGCGAKG